MTAGAGCALFFLASVGEEMGGAVLADKARSMLYTNPGSANAWLSLELEGVRSNRRAMGARIKVVLGAGSEARATQMGLPAQ